MHRKIKKSREKIEEGKVKATERIFKAAKDVVPDEVKKDIKTVYSDQKDFVITEEIGAHATLYLNNEAFFTSLVTEKPSLKKTIIDFFKSAKMSYAKDGRLSRAARKYLKMYSKLFAEMSGVNAQGQSLEIKMPSARMADGEIRASKSIITADMSDEERYEELKDKTITATTYNGEADTLIESELKGKTRTEAKKAVVTIAEKLGIVREQIDFDDIEVEITLSKSNLRESVSKVATPEQIAKLLPILNDTAKSAVLIERHNNRYYFDNDTVYFDNLLSGYIDGDNFIPIRFGLKHSKVGTTTLYVVVDQNEINLSMLRAIEKGTGHQVATPDDSGVDKLRRRSIYSIPQIIRFVNSKDLLRYLPDGMLTEEQRKAKWEGIAETIQRTNEKMIESIQNTSL